MSLLEIRNVIKAFGGLVALNGMNVVIEEGKIYGLIGPNGAGKTTLFNIVSGFYKPDSGDIFFVGENVSFVLRVLHGPFRFQKCFLKCRLSIMY
jgi:branched-chain amino acid transport system ATP-binding protein